MSYSFRSEHWLPYAVEDVFTLFADPANFPTLMPAQHRVRLKSVSLVRPRGSTAHSLTNAAGTGSKIEFSLRPLPRLPIRVRWLAEIMDFGADRFFFFDRQLRGPFRFWQHYHRVRGLDRYGMAITLLIDEVEYDLPFGMIGRMAHSLFVRKQIEEAFAFRHGQVAKMLAQAASAQQARIPESRAS